MRAAEVLSSVLSGAAVLLLAAIGRAILGMKNDFRLFMREHLWLLTTTMWTRDKVLRIMEELDLPVGNPPPSDLPVRKL